MTPWKDFGRYGTVGFELIIWMALGYYGGRAADVRVGGHGWVTFAGFLAGVAVGFRSIFVTGRHLQKELERQERKEKNHDDGKPEN